MWEAIGLVSSGVTLAAFIAAAAATIYSRAARKQERLIKLADEDQRADLVLNALEFFQVDSSKLSRQQQFELALEQIKARARRFMILAISVCFIAVIAGGVTAYAITRDSNNTVTDADIEYQIISIADLGFKGIKPGIQKRELRQIFGDPIEERDRFWQYKGFGAGFNEALSVGNINFDFDGQVPWKTTEGLIAGASRQDVIQLYGIPTSGAAFGGSIYYYDDRFAINFDDNGLLKTLIIYVGERDVGLTFKEIEDYWEESETEVDPQPPVN